MSTEKPKEPISDLTKPNVDDAAAEKVKGGFDPVNSGPSKAEPPSDLRRR